MLKKQPTLFILTVILSLSIQAQKTIKPAVESFENKKVLSEYNKSSKSKITISKDHFKFGKSSLKWEWKGESYFSTKNFRVLSKKESPLRYGDHFPSSPTLVMSIYNETAQNETIKISNADEQNNKAWFKINLNFTGWRTIWVPYYEMQGNTPKKGDPINFNNFKISTTAKKGKLYFDDIVFSQYQDDRHQYPDEIVPFIKSEMKPGADHWMPLTQNINFIKTLKTPTITTQDKNDLKEIEKRLDANFRFVSSNNIHVENLKSDFNKLHIYQKKKTVLGPPMDFKLEQIYFNENQQGKDNHNEVSSLGKNLKNLALAYKHASFKDQKAIEEMFVLGTRYFLDQGWQSGASGGTRHHIGYDVREIADAFYIMRNTLNNNNLLHEVGASLHWLFNVGMVLGDEADFHVNIDYLNTQAYYHLMLIFLTKPIEKQAALLKKYSNYISITLAQQKEEWGFKIDGTAWHHNGHYPAYGMGAFNNVPNIIKTLSGTEFRIGEAGHQNFKNAFLATHLYSQKLDYGFGNAGRHPLEDNSIKSLKDDYLKMALSGNPKGTEEVDTEVAAAYLYLWGEQDKLTSKKFEKLNIKKEVLPTYKTFPYAATAIHRGNNWAALIKGYSKYVWASEIYVASNRYGRYPANGTIELINQHGEKASGFLQNGWDWNRYPGGTIVYLPLEELEPNTPLLMFRSNETFAGAIEQNGNGLFSMILNESKGSNADGKEVNIGFSGKLKAHKSVFSFGDKLICIGTNISSIDTINPTQTTLFQSAIKTENTPVFSEIGGSISQFPYNNESGKYLIDPYGNGYHILSNTKSFVSKKLQNSYHNKYSIKTGAMNPKGKGAKTTKGNFASAWIDHGNAPKDASYQYVIYPFMSAEETKSFKNLANKDNSFKIIKADSIAHVVIDKTTNTTAYTIFEKETNIKDSIIQKVSKPCLLMIHKSNEHHLKLSFVQPDLNFKEIKSNRFYNYSNELTTSIYLKGAWKTTSNQNVTSLFDGKNTILTFSSKDGFTNSVEITKN
ncbi:chondroitinase family polysaccharide lyase [Wenyingzhuangia sp. IMCC45467]